MTASIELPPPPRALTPILVSYAGRSITAAWPALVGIALGLGFVVASPVPAAIASVALAGEVILLAAASLLYWSTRRRRARLCWVLARGEVVTARVIAIRDLRPHSVASRYVVELDVGDCKLALAIRDPRVGLWRVGATEPVLWDASVPEVIVPTSLLSAQ